MLPDCSECTYFGIPRTLTGPWGLELRPGCRKIIVREAAALFVQDAVVGIVGGKLGQNRAEGLAVLQVFENEVGAMLVVALHGAEPGPDIVFLAYALLGSGHGNPALPGVGVDHSGGRRRVAVAALLW